VDRHLPHDTARNARFFVGIVNAAKMEIFSAGQQAGLGAALGGLGRGRVGGPVGGVAVGRGADVVPGQGVFLESFPAFFLELDAVPLGDALLDAAD